MIPGPGRDALGGGSSRQRGHDAAGRTRHFARIDPTITAVVGQDGRFSIASEHYRNLAFRIEEEAREATAGGLVMAVTSAEPSTGKTLICLNLALTLARGSKERILLVEVDLRRPVLESYLQTFFVASRGQERPLLKSDSPPLGLLQVLEQGVELGDALLPVWGTRLDLLLAGREGVIENVTARDGMSELLDRLRSSYRIVILDAPPLILADGRSAAARADRTLLVVRAGRTKRKQVEKALALLDPEKTLGLVLNGTRPEPETPYSHYQRAVTPPLAMPGADVTVRGQPVETSPEGDEP